MLGRICGDMDALTHAGQVSVGAGPFAVVSLVTANVSGETVEWLQVLKVGYATQAAAQASMDLRDFPKLTQMMNELVSKLIPSVTACKSVVCLAKLTRIAGTEKVMADLGTQ